MNKNDIKTLYTLVQNECTNSIKSFTITKLSPLTNLSKAKLRNTLTLFKALNYVDTGYPDGHSSTYYITAKGIEFLKGVSK